MIAQWTQWMSTASVQLAVLIILIGTITFVGRRLSARLRYALWLLVLLKALLPPFFGTPWSVVNQTAWLFPAVQSETVHETVEVPIGQDEGLHDEMVFETSGERQTVVRGSETYHYAMRRADYVFAVWFGGVVLFWGIVGFNYFRAVNILAHGHWLKTGPLVEMLNRLKSRGVVPQIVLSDSVGSPFIWGLFTPKIAIPADFPGEVSPDEMQSVLLHELTHWKRGDLFVARFELLVQGLFWFHPLVWFAVWQLRRERELSCDEAVLESGIAARQYGGSLLNVFNAVRNRSPLPIGFLGVVGILERKSQFQQRLEEIMLQQNQVRKIGTLGWGLILFVFLCVLPMATAQDKPAVSPSSETESSDSLNITEKNGKFTLRIGNVEIAAKPLSEAPTAKRDESKYLTMPAYLLKRKKLGASTIDLLKSKYEELCPELSKKYPFNGVLVAAIMWNGSFDKLGVMPDDILIGIDHSKILSAKDVTAFSQKRFDTDTVVKVWIFRNDQCYFVDVPVKAWVEPEPPQAADGGYAPEGGFTHLVTFQAEGDFVPRNPMDYLRVFNHKLNVFRIHAGYFRTKSVNGKLIAMDLTSTPDEYKKLVDSIPQLKYVRTERLTKETFEAYEKTKQESLPPADGGFATPGKDGVSGFTHLVTFKAKGDFVPRNPMDYLKISHAHPDSNNVYRGYFRTKIENGKLIASHLTDDPEAMRKMIESTPQFEYVKTERLTKETFEAYEKTKQESLPPADGGYASPEYGFTHLVTFKAKGDFVPKNPMDYMGLLNPKLNEFGVHAGYFRSKPVDGKLIAMNLTSTPDEYKKSVDSIPQFEYVKTERLTKEMFEAYEKTKQESLPPADGGYASPEYGFTHLVTFKAKGDFVPKNPQEYLSIFMQPMQTERVHCGYFRTKNENGKLTGSFLTNTPEKFEKMVVSSMPDIEFVKAQRLTKEMFEAYEKTKQESLPPADGGYASPDGDFTHLVTFKAKGDFAPKNPQEYLSIFMQPMQTERVHCGYFRTKNENGKLTGSFLTNTPEKFEKMVVSSMPDIEFVKAQRLTKEMFEAYEKTKQESLP